MCWLWIAQGLCFVSPHAGIHTDAAAISSIFAGYHGRGVVRCRDIVLAIKCSDLEAVHVTYSQNPIVITSHKSHLTTKGLGSVPRRWKAGKTW